MFFCPGDLTNAIITRTGKIYLWTWRFGILHTLFADFVIHGELMRRTEDR